MAGDWTKVEHATPDKTEVLAVAAALGIDADSAFGKVFRMWRWFDQHTENGNAPRVTPSLLDGIIGVTGFAHAVEKVGWLTITDDGLSLPNFDRHTSKTAKSRALTAKRVAASRSKSNARGNGGGNGTNVTDALAREEKRRVTEKSKKPPVVPLLPKILDTPEFHTALQKWLAYKGPKAYKPAGLEGQVSLAAKRAEQFGVDAVIAAMERARGNSWEGWDQDSSFQPRAGPRKGRDPNDPYGNHSTAQKVLEDLNHGR